MAMGPRRRRKKATVQYRRLTQPESLLVESSLQTELSKALDIAPNGTPLVDDVALRRFEWSQDRTLVLNKTERPEEFFFGQLALFQPGGLITLIQQYSRPVTELEIQQDQPHEGMEYLPGLLYFMAVGNHVFSIESASVRSTALSDYIAWLLGPDHTELLATSLCTLTPDVRIMMDEGNEPAVKQAELRVGANDRESYQPASSETSKERTTAKILEHFTALPEKGRKVLEAIGATDASIEQLKASLPPEAFLEVIVQLRAVTRERVQEINPAFVNDMFDVSSEDKMILRGPEGTRVGQIGRLTHPVNVEVVDDLLVPEDVMRALYEAYSVLVANGRIDEVG